MSEDPIDRLDALLSVWGQQRRLSPAQAAEIRQAVLAPEEPGLPTAWWCQLSEHVTAAIVRASTIPQATMPLPAGART